MIQLMIPMRFLPLREAVYERLADARIRRVTSMILHIHCALPLAKGLPSNDA